MPSRLFNVNKLSAAESPLQPEIVVGFSSGRKAAQGFILFDKQSNFYHAPIQQLTDAIFDDERKLIVTLEPSEKPRQKTHQTVRLLSFE